MRSQYIKDNPKIKFYRNYKTFDKKSFHTEKGKRFNLLKILTYISSSFQSLCTHLLRKNPKI